MTRALHRLPVVLALTALSGACAAGPAWGQASDSGGADKGESASAWHGILVWGGWILLAVVIFGGLLWMALGRRRDDAPPDTAQPAAPAQARRHRRRRRSLPRRQDSDAHELTVLTFDHIEGAERAYADARGRSERRAVAARGRLRRVPPPRPDRRPRDLRGSLPRRG